MVSRVTGTDLMNLRHQVVQRRLRENNAAFRTGELTGGTLPGSDYQLASSSIGGEERGVLMTILDTLGALGSGTNAMLIEGAKETKRDYGLADDASLSWNQQVESIGRSVNNLGEFGQGVRGALPGGEGYTTFAEALNEYNSPATVSEWSPAARFGASLAGEIATDPLSYVGVGAVRAGLSKIGANKAVPEAIRTKDLESVAAESRAASTAEEVALQQNPIVDPRVKEMALKDKADDLERQAWEREGFQEFPSEPLSNAPTSAAPAQVAAQAPVDSTAQIEEIQRQIAELAEAQNVREQFLRGEVEFPSSPLDPSKLEGVDPSQWALDGAQEEALRRFSGIMPPVGRSPAEALPDPKRMETVEDVFATTEGGVSVRLARPERSIDNIDPDTIPEGDIIRMDSTYDYPQLGEFGQEILGSLQRSASDSILDLNMSASYKVKDGKVSVTPASAEALRNTGAVDKVVLDSPAEIAFSESFQEVMNPFISTKLRRTKEGNWEEVATTTARKGEYVPWSLYPEKFRLKVKQSSNPYSGLPLTPQRAKQEFGVSLRPVGTTAKKGFSAKEYWELMTKGSVIRTQSAPDDLMRYRLEDLEILTSVGSKTGERTWTKLSDVKRIDDKTLADPKWWAKAIEETNDLASGANPKRWADAVARQHAAIQKGYMGQFEQYKAQWKAQVTDYLGVTDEVADAAFDAAREFLDREWQNFLRTTDPDKQFLSMGRLTEATDIMRKAAQEAMSPAELQSRLTVLNTEALIAQSAESTKKSMTRAERTLKALQKGDQAAAENSAKRADDAMAEATVKQDEATLENVKAQVAKDMELAENKAKAVNATSTPETVEAVFRGRIQDSTDPIWQELDPVLISGMDNPDAWLSIARGAVKDAVTDTLDKHLTHTARKVGGRYFNQMVQQKTVESAIKGLRKRMTGLRSVEGLDAQASVISTMEYNIAIASLRAMEKIYPPTVWNGLSKTARAKGANGGYHIPSVGDRLDIVTGNWSQKIDPKQAYNLNPYFSMRLMMEHLGGVARGTTTDVSAHISAIARPDLLSRLFIGTPTEPTVSLIHLASAALYKGEEYLATLPKELAEWAKKYPSWDNTAYVDDMIKRQEQIAVPAAVESAAKHVDEVITEGSPAKVAKVVDEAEEVAAKSAGLMPGISVPVAEKAGKAAGVTAHTTSVGSINTMNAVGVTTKRVAGRLDEADNNAAREVARASGAKPVTVDEVTVSPDSFNNSIGARLAEAFIPHYRMPHVRTIEQDAFGRMQAAQSYSTRHWRTLHDLAKDPANASMVKEGLISYALKGSFPVETLSDEAIAIHNQFEQLIGTFFRSELFQAYGKGTTTVSKTGISLERANYWLRTKGVRGTDGKIFQFEDVPGGTWDMSWRNLVANITDENAADVVSALHGVEQGMYSAIAERILFDDMVVRFGHTKAAPGMIKVKGHPYFEGGEDVYLLPEIAQEVNQLLRNFKKAQNLTHNNILATYDTGLRLWKTGVTIYRPAHHIRNLVGDFYLLLADGGRTMDYANALRIMSRNRSRWRNMQPEDAIIRGMTREGMLKGGAESASSGPLKFRNSATGREFTEHEIISAAHSRGIFQSAANIEDITYKGLEKIDFGESLAGIRPLGGKGHDIASGTAEAREHSVRLAHFLAATRTVKVPKAILKEGDEKVAEYIFNHAARRTRKWHPDGLDMTNFERSVGRRVIPFYSWLRKATPLVLQTMAMRPALTTAYPRMQRAGSYAVDPTNPEGELPGDQFYPDWIRNSPWMVLPKIATGGPDDPAFGSLLGLGPSTPGIDQLRTMVGSANTPGEILPEALAELGGSTSPALRVPFELAANREVRTGAPIHGDYSKNTRYTDYSSYLLEQIPIIGEAFRLGVKNKNPAWMDALNWGGATGLIPSGEYETSGEFDELKRLRRINSVE